MSGEFTAGGVRRLRAGRRERLRDGQGGDRQVGGGHGGVPPHAGAQGLRDCVNKSLF